MATTTKKEKKIRVDITLPESVLSIVNAEAERGQRTLSAQIAYLTKRQLFRDYWDSFIDSYEIWESMTREEYEKESRHILESAKRAEYYEDDIRNLGTHHGALLFYAEKEGYFYRSAPGAWEGFKEGGEEPLSLFRLAEQIKHMRAGKVPDAEISEAVGVPPLALDKFVKTFKLEKPRPTHADKEWLRKFSRAPKKG